MDASYTYNRLPGGAVRKLARRALGDVLTLEESAEVLAAREAQLLNDIAVFDKVNAMKRAPLERQLEGLHAKKQYVEHQLEMASRSPDNMPHPPGPEHLAWVESDLFACLCNIVLFANLIAMVIAPWMENLAFEFHIANHLFLFWYVFELSVKSKYHQRNLFFGPLSRVWWNWLDLCIVVGGVVDQWLLAPMLGHSTSNLSTSALRSLRLFRLFRLLRVVKFAKVLATGDLKWAESAEFEIFMSSVISLNAVAMSLELDYTWSGWPWVENVFLIIYLFELLVRFKREGRIAFFCSPNTAFWNYLDSAIVCGGIVDLWLAPQISLFRHVVLGQDVAQAAPSPGITSLLKLMRMLRVLRLVRLMRSVKPLYRLLLGVIESFKAMQWVILLTMVVLYGGAIFWTSLIGKGLMYDGDVPDDVEENFGTVPRSMFSLFRLMNGDTEVVATITKTIWGQLLFVGFMVLSNWAILAILTSAVSDNMISSSHRVREQDKECMAAIEYAEKVAELRKIFSDIDSDGTGAVSEVEWKRMIDDPQQVSALCSAAGMHEKDLGELFSYLAVNAKVLQRGTEERPKMDFLPEGADSNLSPRHKEVDSLLYYSTFVEHLRDDREPADKRSVLRMLSRMQAMEAHMEKRLDAITVILRTLQLSAIAPTSSWDGRLQGGTRERSPSSSSSSPDVLMVN